MGNQIAYTIIVFVLDLVMVLLTIAYFYLRIPPKQPYKKMNDEDLFKNYKIIKYQKRLIRLLKLRLFFLNTFFRNRGVK